MYDLVVCAVVKNEAPYLEEWLCWHLLQGVEHFYIWENDSDDDTWKILSRYAEKGLVTPAKVHGCPCQMDAYHNFLKAHKNEANWVAFIDCDEFLYAPDTRKLPEVLKQYQPYSGVAVHWIFFGSNGHRTKTPGLVIERFTKCCCTVSDFVKSILHPTQVFIRPANNSHAFQVLNYVVDENERMLPSNYTGVNMATAKVLCIAHFHTKSYEEAMLRWSLNGSRRVFDGVSFGDLEVKFTGHDINDESNFFLANQSGKVKEKVKELA